MRQGIHSLADCLRARLSISKLMEANHLLYIFTYFALSRNLFCTRYSIESVGRTNDFSIGDA
jgi:hypothetical protein